MLDEHKTTVWIFSLSAPRSFGSFSVTVADHLVFLIPTASAMSPGVFQVQMYLLVICNVLDLSSVPFRRIFVEISVPCFSEGIHSTVKCSWTVESIKSQFLRAADEFRTHHPGK